MIPKRQREFVKTLPKHLRYSYLRDYFKTFDYALFNLAVRTVKTLIVPFEKFAKIIKTLVEYLSVERGKIMLNPWKIEVTNVAGVLLKITLVDRVTGECKRVDLTVDQINGVYEKRAALENDVDKVGVKDEDGKKRVNSSPYFEGLSEGV